jgi:hypothetical protein
MSNQWLVLSSAIHCAESLYKYVAKGNKRLYESETQNAALNFFLHLFQVVRKEWFIHQIVPPFATDLAERQVADFFLPDKT